MIIKPNQLFAALLVLVAFAAPATARVEWRIEGDVPLPGKAVDVGATADGKRVFVLMEGGEVRIYSEDGTLEENLGIIGQADRLAVSPTGDRIYLIGQKGERLRIAAVDTIHSFDLTGSPVKGPVDAPVEIVAFSDFQ